MKYWMEQGAPADKIIMGMPLYGQAFTLDSDQNTGLNAPANKKGKAGPFTKASGFLAYYEICDMIKNQGWNVVKDPEGRMGPYAYKDRNWVRTFLMRQKEVKKSQNEPKRDKMGQNRPNWAKIVEYLIFHTEKKYNKMTTWYLGLFS